MPRVLELALDYRCNLRCLGCRACVPTGDSLAPERAARLLREGRGRGARMAWFGGGEPTLRDDLLALVRRARDLGYERVVIQTNAARLSYATYAKALLAAGATEIRVNAKSARAEVHDRLSRVPGTHALLVQAIEHLRGLGAAVTADVLLARSTVDHLDETVAFFADRGVRAFALWLLYAGDTADPPTGGGQGHDGADLREDAARDAAEVEREVPRLADFVPALERAAAVARARAVSLVSFHTPPCALPEALRGIWLPAKDLDLAVVDPAGAAFPLETSPFEGGGHVEACAGCAAAARCGGPRRDYVRLHGASEFRALSSMGAR